MKGKTHLRMIFHAVCIGKNPSLACVARHDKAAACGAVLPLSLPWKAVVGLCVHAVDLDHCVHDLSLCGSVGCVLGWAVEACIPALVPHRRQMTQRQRPSARSSRSPRLQHTKSMHVKHMHYGTASSNRGFHSAPLLPLLPTRFPLPLAFGVPLGRRARVVGRDLLLLFPRAWAVMTHACGCLCTQQVSGYVPTTDVDSGAALTCRGLAANSVPPKRVRESCCIAADKGPAGVVVWSQRALGKRGAMLHSTGACLSKYC